ncbi:MAG: hypothetical protein LBR36_01320 [Bacteroidales bacterium]|nr:hypothetical protein [Bacteroidales bacterium]
MFVKCRKSGQKARDSRLAKAALVLYFLYLTIVYGVHPLLHISQVQGLVLQSRQAFSELLHGKNEHNTADVCSLCHIGVVVLHVAAGIGVLFFALPALQECKSMLINNVIRCLSTTCVPRAPPAH